MRYNIVENCRSRGKRDLFSSRNYARVVYYLFVYLYLFTQSDRVPAGRSVYRTRWAPNEQTGTDRADRLYMLHLSLVCGFPTD